MSKHRLMCDLCGEGTLEQQQGVNTVTYKKNSRELITDFSECDVCGVEMMQPQQARDNKRRMTAFKKEVDGLLTGAEVRLLRERLGLKQSEAAQLFGGGAVAFSKYENDDVSQSEAMDKLIRLADSLPEAFTYLHKRSGLVPDSNVIRPAEWHVIAKDSANEENVDDGFFQVAETSAAYQVPKSKPVEWRECEGC